MRSSHHAYTPRTSPHLPSGSNTRGSPAPRTGELDMEMIQSVSRSGGDGAEGDAYVCIYLFRPNQFDLISQIEGLGYPGAI